MDPLSSAASVIALIQLAGRIVKICGDYIQEVKNARAEILEVQQAVTDLAGVLRELHVLLQGPNGPSLSSSQTLDVPITNCSSTLTALELTIGLRKRNSMMRRLRFQALAWPLKRIEVEKIISKIERYKSTFTLSLQIDQTTIINSISETTGRVDRNMDLKQLPVARGAEFDSYPNQYEDYCLSGTRTDLLHDVMEWAKLPLGKSCFWLIGGAGTGKSTISRTIAKNFKDANLLGASFFFKRGEEDRANAMKLFPTITKQLVKRIPQLIPGVQKAIQDNSDISTKGLKEQFDKLLLQPLLDLNLIELSTLTLVIVIDALDECDVDNDIRLLLQLLPRLQTSETVRLRVFLTSRPEWPILQEVSQTMSREHEGLILHEIPKPVIEHDISLFLEHRLSAIRKDRILPFDWPGKSDFQKLVTLSAPLFIFAATICRIFEDPHWDPVDSLHEILTHRSDKSKLDGTYLPVLNRLLKSQDEKQRKQLAQEFQQVVGALLILECPLSVTSLSSLTGLPERLVHLRLSPLHSVLYLPDDNSLPIRLFHLSFRNFLLDLETREKTLLWVDEKEMHSKLATRCLFLCQNLRKNICELPNDGTQRAIIDHQTIDHNIPPELQYSCRYWAHHIAQCADVKNMLHDVHIFLQRHFLHWVEVMSILGLMTEVVDIINTVQTLIRDGSNPAMFDFLYDAKRFILKNRSLFDDVPLQIYCSGLIFAPEKSIIRREYKTEIPKWMRLLPKVAETWDSELQTLAHSKPVYSVAFSPDSCLLASGSQEKAVWLWNTATTTVQQTLEGHLGLVRSVVFSPDGRLLASGSYDKTVRLWDPTTGALEKTLKGHLSWVQSVTFSPDGQLIASGSDDKTVCLWNTATGILQQTIKGHFGGVRSVAFSPGGQILISGSEDKTIRIWSTATGTLQQILKGHSSGVGSVAFSPNGHIIISGAEDNTIRIWNTATGVLQKTLKGHSSGVRSVVYSPDGQRIASGSWDKTVRIWDAVSGALIQTLKGHWSVIESVAFSPNGRLLASGSNEKTVRLWDVAIDALQWDIESHSGIVWSVAFSPDGRILASGSYDNTVRFWDTATYTLQRTLESHRGAVKSVAFSPNSQILASGSYDKTVKLWNAATGALQQTLKSHKDAVKSVVFSPNGRLLASGSFDMTVRLWDVATGILQQTLKGHTGCVQSVTFSPDGRLLASGSDDKTVRLWDSTTGALQQTFEGHEGWVWSVAFSPNGQLLASGSSDKTVRLWDIVSGALQQTLSVDGAVITLAFSQDWFYLSNKLGSLNNRTWSGNFPSHLPEAKLEISIHEGQWINLGRGGELWLPPDFRPVCSAIIGSTIALGHASGRVSFIGIRV